MAHVFHNGLLRNDTGVNLGPLVVVFQELATLPFNTVDGYLRDANGYLIVKS